MSVQQEDHRIDSDVFQYYTGLAIAGHLSILGSVFFLVRKNFRHLAFAILGTYSCFLPESSIFPIRHLIFDHRVYFPFVFVIVFLYFTLSPEGKAGPKFLSLTSKQTSSFLFGLLLLLSIPYAYSNWSYSSKISTYDKWVSYNFEQEPANVDFNVFELVELYQRNRVMGAAPEIPFFKPSQYACRVFPIGVSAPTPVITTLLKVIQWFVAEGRVIS